MSETTLLGERVKASDPLFGEVLDFYWNEAELLDEDRLWEWAELLDEGIHYFMPVRETVQRKDGRGFAEKMAHFDEDLGQIKLRIARVLNTNTAYAEDPPSRALRYVTNVRVHRIDANTLQARSYVLMTRSRWDYDHFELLACERVDELRIVDGGFKIANRTIYIQQSRVGLTNVALFV